MIWGYHYFGKHANACNWQNSDVQLPETFCCLLVVLVDQGPANGAPSLETVKAWRCPGSVDIYDWMTTPGVFNHDRISQMKNKHSWLTCLLQKVHGFFLIRKRVKRCHPQNHHVFILKMMMVQHMWHFQAVGSPNLAQWHQGRFRFQEPSNYICMCIVLFHVISPLPGANRSPYHWRETPHRCYVLKVHWMLPRSGWSGSLWSTSMALEIPSFVNVCPKKVWFTLLCSLARLCIVWLTEILMCLNLQVDTTFPNAYATMPVVGRDFGCFKSHFVRWLGIDGIEVWFVSVVSQTCLGFPQDSGQNPFAFAIGNPALRGKNVLVCILMPSWIKQLIVWCTCANGCSITPLKINIEPENDGLADDFPFQTADLQLSSR